MSTFVCPGCTRSFAEAGFCPYDGRQLTAPVSDGAPAAVTVRDLAAHPPKAAARSMTVPQFGNATIETAPPVIAGPGASPGPSSGGSPAPGPGLNLGTSPTEPTVESRTELPTHRDSVLANAVPEPAVKPPSKSPGLRALSASEEPDKALANLRRGTVYDQLVGQTLDGRYYIERKIGEGGMGVVYSARHAVIERPLAVKVLKREALRDSATASRFVQEAKAASRIGHPNIVDVTDFGTTSEGLHYSVMEYVKGVTLALVIKTNAPLPIARASGIAQQLARALGAAHEKGIVHRDLKPENIFLVDRDGRPDFVKIVDFGIAKVTPIDGQAAGPRLTRAGSVFGTPEYMAPEQAAGRSDIDGRVDIYALGVILYEMITGKLPLKGESTVRTIAMQLLDPIVPPTQIRPDLDIGPDCEAIIMKALAKRRDERYRTMAELQSALELLMRSRPAVRAAAPPIAGLAPLPPGADPRLVEGVHTQAQTQALGPVSSLGIPGALLGVEPSRPLPAPPGGAGASGGVPLGPLPGAASGPLRGDPAAVRASRPGEDPMAAGRMHRPSEGPPLPPPGPPGRAHRPSESSPGAAAVGSSGSARAYQPPPEAPPASQRAVRDEPEFVKTGMSSFDHVFVEAPAAPPRRRWPFLIAALLVAVGAGITMAMIAQRQDEPVAVAANPADARLAGDPPGDPLPEAPPPGGPAPDPGPGSAGDPQPDGGSSGKSGSAAPSPGTPGGHRDGGDGGKRPIPRDRRDARVNETVRRDVTVQILTYPEEGTVYRGRTYRGPAGTTVVEPYGTVARFTCTKVGYKEGYVDVKFDEKTPIAVCVMTRKKLCVDDLKNPYDHCPDAGPAEK